MALGATTYTSVTWTTGDVITEAKLDNMVANDQAYDSHSAQGILLNNNVGFYQKDSGGANRAVANLDSSDVLQIGDSGIDGIQFEQDPDIPIYYYRDTSDTTYGPYNDTNRHNISGCALSITLNKTCDVLVIINAYMVHNDIYGMTPSVTKNGGTSSTIAWLSGWGGVGTGTANLAQSHMVRGVDQNVVAGTYTYQVQLSAAGATSAVVTVYDLDFSLQIIEIR